MHALPPAVQQGSPSNAPDEDFASGRAEISHCTGLSFFPRPSAKRFACATLSLARHIDPSHENLTSKDLVSTEARASSHSLLFWQPAIANNRANATRDSSQAMSRISHARPITVKPENR